MFMSSLLRKILNKRSHIFRDIYLHAIETYTHNPNHCFYEINPDISSIFEECYFLPPGVCFLFEIFPVHSNGLTLSLTIRKKISQVLLLDNKIESFFLFAKKYQPIFFPSKFNCERKELFISVYFVFQHFSFMRKPFCNSGRIKRCDRS